MKGEEVGTQSGGTEPMEVGAWDGPDESKRNMSMPPMSESVVSLRDISTADVEAWSNGDVQGHGEDGPVRPLKVQAASNGCEVSKYRAYSEGEYSSTWSRRRVRGPKDWRLPMAAPAGGCRWETGTCWLWERTMAV